MTGPGVEPRVVRGSVRAPAGALPAAGAMRVTVDDIRLGGERRVGEATAAADGSWALRYDPDAVRSTEGASLDLVVRVRDDDGTVLAVSDVRYDATASEVIDVDLPTGTRPGPDEYTRLTTSLAPLLDAAPDVSFAAMADGADPAAARRDTAFLGAKTGWDPHLVALASQARAAEERTGIAAPFHYALYRVGLPAGDQLWALATEDALRGTWERARDDGTIPADVPVSEALVTAAGLARRAILELPTGVGDRSFADLLTSLPDNGARTRFVDLYRRHRDDPAALWAAVDAALEPEQARDIALDGALASVTGNNAELITRLHDGPAPAGLADLARAGFHHAQRWEDELADDVPIPDDVPCGASGDGRRAYAEQLAVRLRLHAPTAVLGAEVADGTVPVAGPDGTSQAVAEFLTGQHGRFEIGLHTVAPFVASHGLDVAPETVHAVEGLQRVAAISPTPAALHGLAGRGVASAAEVAAVPEADFVSDAAGDVGGPVVAREVHRRSSRVHHAALTVVTAALADRAAPDVRVVRRGGAFSDEFVPALAGLPTLENLLGPQETQACEHCGSVLSPAAYLVDLLEFLAVPSRVTDGTTVQEVLAGRRPDLENLALSCENTEIALPYVDLVVEILEHRALHDSMDGYAGHDTAPGVESADLLATPRFVNEKAYAALLEARYPVGLPFDRRLESLRAHLDRAKVALADVLPVLHPLPPDDAHEGPWRDALDERLGVSPAERAVLCSATVSAAELFGDDPARVGANDLVRGVSNAVRLARRIGLTSTEVVELLQTRFLNPATTLYALLDALEVEFGAIADVLAGRTPAADFRGRTPSDLDLGPYGGDVVTWLQAHRETIESFVVLTDPAATAGDAVPPRFADLQLRRATAGGSDPLRVVDLLAIARFARLRARLGWSIAQTDALLTALWPADVAHPVTTGDPAAARAALDAGMASVLTRTGHLFGVAAQLGRTLPTDLRPLLGYVAPLGVDGADAPYRRMFLRADVAGVDDAFELGPDGRPAPGAALLDHTPALLAALALTADELAAIVGALGYGPATPLDLETIGAVFRRGHLARALRLPVRDLLDLVVLSGLDPFTPPDGPDPALPAFVGLARRIAESGLTVERTAAAVLRPDTVAIDVAGSDLARALRDALRSPDRVTTGPWTLDRLAAELAPAFDADTVDTLIGLLQAGTVHSAPYEQDEPTLPGVFATVTRRLGYDHARSLLVHRGPLTTAETQALRDHAADAGDPDAFDAAVTGLVNAASAAHGPFLRDHPELAARWETYADTTRALDPDDPDTATLVEVAMADVAAGLAEPVRAAVRRAVVGTVLAAAVRHEPADVLALADDAAMLGTAPDRPLLDDLVAVAEPGVTVAYREPGAQDWRVPITAPGLAYGAGAVSLPDESGTAGPRDGRWSWHLEPPVPGRYTLLVDTDAAQVELVVGGTPQPLERQGSLWRGPSGVDLPAGALTEFTLEVSGVTERLVVEWLAPDAGIARQPLPAAGLLPSAQVRRVARARHRIATLLDLAGALGSSVVEVAATARSRTPGAGGWPSALPVDGPAADPPGLLEGVDALIGHRALRERWSAPAPALAAVLDGRAPDTAAALAALTGRDAGTVAAALARVTGDPAPTAPRPATLLRLADLLDLAVTVPLGPDALADALTVAPDEGDLRAVRDALRARHDQAGWQDWIRPVHDRLRRSNRDALVGYVLARHAPDPDAPDAVPPLVDTPDKLYEELLVDVAMDPCTQTSRILQAIATVQLFVSRCLLNLEPAVAPWAIDAGRWEWMKRYRVWEANRSVFLHAENWLDPELRTTKSPFFDDLESELLQSDVTDQLATVAIGHYLERLDEVAKLEISAMHVEERRSGDVPTPVVHVIGRTSGAKRTYFHRLLDGTWGPWRRIPLDIPDDPVLPVVWGGRLLLFWLRISKQPRDPSPSLFPKATGDGKPLIDMTLADLPDPATVSLTASLFWSEYYNGRWQSPRTSDPERPMSLGAEFPVGGDAERLQLASRIDGDGPTSTLGIAVLDPAGGNKFFRLHTPHSLPVRDSDPDPGPSVGFPADLSFSESVPEAPAPPFSVGYPPTGAPLVLLNTPPGPYRTVAAAHPLERPREAPFFLQDRRHVFYVHPGTGPDAPAGPLAFGRFPDAITGPPPTGVVPDPLADPSTVPSDHPGAPA